MNNKSIKKELLVTLETMRQVFAAACETELRELKKRDRESVFNIFGAFAQKCGIEGEYDNDSDGSCYIYEVFDELRIVFSSDNPNGFDVPDNMYSNVACHQSTAIGSIISAVSSYAFEDMPIALLNTSILTAPGEYRLLDITVDDAKEIIEGEELDSAIGHQSTADIISTLLGVDVPLNRQMFAHDVGQRAIVFKLNGRPEEGKVLTVDEIDQIGYKFQLLVRDK